MDEERGKLIYILPNLFTASSVFLAIISIISTINGNFSAAIFYIILSLIFDGLDGRVARLTHATSKFGVEFDSLADIVAFGVAPAILFYCTIGQSFGKVGSLVAALYVVFGAIRLARFNVTTGTYEPSVFIGLPIPTAAIMTAFWIGIYLQYDLPKACGVLYIFGVLSLSLLMVSNIRFPSFKKIDFKKANFKKALVVLIVIFSILYLYPLEFAAFLISAYVIYGLARTAINLANSKFFKPRAKSEADAKAGCAAGSKTDAKDAGGDKNN